VADVKLPVSAVAQSHKYAEIVIFKKSIFSELFRIFDFIVENRSLMT